ncbi:MAG: site-specific DNA-methyltransferase, partial [Gaiella sp.]|nr:site-specific DNA-methyltransferase [Gaiella sp.]
PPFATGANFSFQADVGESTFEKEPSIIEQKAYRDTWGRGLDSYFQWFSEAVLVLHELLSESGSLYVHCDWRVNAGIRQILDEVLSPSNFVNEIVWKKIRVVKAQSRGYGNVHDVIFKYAKNADFKFNQQRIVQDPQYEKKFDKVEPGTGRRYQLVSLLQAGGGPTRRFGDKVLDPGPGRHWIWSQERIDQAMQLGLIEFTSGGMPRKKQYLDESEGRLVDDLWTDIYPVNSQALEDTGYATQKPEALLERIIRASSDENDLVLDCFCGSGTTPAIAEKLGRRWIACDLGRFAIHTTRKRLLGIEGVRPFVVQNLGKYERQVWQKAEFGERAEATVRAYRRFILDLYHAEPVEGYAWLHGKKGGRMVHVGTVDTPVALGDVKQIAIEFRRAIGTGKGAPQLAGVDVLGWDFALDMNETAKQIAQEAGLDVRFVRIPREVLEKKAVEQGDIRFFELAALSVDVQVKGRELAVTLTDFMVPPDDVPEDVIKAVKHWSEWIDYWAVDFNYRDDTFHNEWQSYRTRKDRGLTLSVRNKYEQPGTYTALVKVIDILGNDTTKGITVEVH